MVPKQPLKFALIAASVCALLPLIPITLAFVVFHAPDSLKNLVLYTVPMMLIASPAAMILDKFGLVGSKFLVLSTILTWFLYLLPSYLAGWLWYIWRTPGSLYRGHRGDR